MANLMAAIEEVMVQWRAKLINNRDAYEQISKLILDYQKADWQDSHS